MGQLTATALGFRGAFSAPHRMAALAGRDILENGGSAMEAMVAAAAMIAVVYPHMNGIGGDGFWIVRRPGEAPLGISACGRAAALATPGWYAARGYDGALPTRGGHAALTAPATLRGWEAALALVPKTRRLSLRELLGAAIEAARGGFAVSAGQAGVTAAKLDELKSVHGFAGQFLFDGHPPAAGDRLVQSALAETLETIAADGFEAFYRGDIAAGHAAFLAANDSPLRREDLAACRAEMAEPLTVEVSRGKLYNMPPPTQGVSSLMIMAMYDRLGVPEANGFEHIHALVEATKQAFLLRDRELADPDAMKAPAAAWLSDAMIARLCTKISPSRALPWPVSSNPGDTVWMGCVDRHGTAISFIQSVYWEFGSGLTCPQTGVYFQNRGAGFSLQPGPNQVAPGKRPFHTLNPAMAELRDGSTMAYGTMGGDGQPQTQAAIVSRHVWHGIPLQEAIHQPRWLLGRTWGDINTSLKLESRFDEQVVLALSAAGHEVEVIEPFSELVGHAGAVVRHSNGLIECAADPRCDGAALAF